MISFAVKFILKKEIIAESQKGDHHDDEASSTDLIVGSAIVVGAVEHECFLAIKLTESRRCTYI